MSSLYQLKRECMLAFFAEDKRQAQGRQLHTGRIAIQW